MIRLLCAVFSPFLLWRNPVSRHALSPRRFSLSTKRASTHQKTQQRKKLSNFASHTATEMGLAIESHFGVRAVLALIIVLASAWCFFGPASQSFREQREVQPLIITGVTLATKRRDGSPTSSRAETQAPPLPSVELSPLESRPRPVVASEAPIAPAAKALLNGDDDDEVPLYPPCNLGQLRQQAADGSDVHFQGTFVWPPVVAGGKNRSGQGLQFLTDGVTVNAIQTLAVDRPPRVATCAPLFVFRHVTLAAGRVVVQKARRSALNLTFSARSVVAADVHFARPPVTGRSSGNTATRAATTQGDRLAAEIRGRMVLSAGDAPNGKRKLASILPPRSLSFDWKDTSLVRTSADFISDADGGRDAVRASVLPGDAEAATHVFRRVLILPSPICQQNLWHGFVEFVVPLFDALTRLRWRTTGRPVDDVAFVIDAPALDVWGARNAYCKSMNTHPYGLGAEHWTTQALLLMLNITHAQLMKQVFFVGEMRRAKDEPPPTPWRGVLEAEEAALGFSRLCFPEVENQESENPKRYLQWPYYNFTAKHGEGRYCRALYAAMRAGALRSLGYSPGKGADRPLTLQETACPTVRVVKRIQRNNGRLIRNNDQVLRALRDALKEHCAVHAARLGVPLEVTFEEVLLEGMTFHEQVGLMLNTTIFVGARGAGLVNTLFQRSHSGLFVLFPASPTIAVSRDSYPFYPFSVFPEKRTIVTFNCRAIPSGNPFCSSHPNFCDVACPVENVKEHMEFALASVRAHAEEATLISGTRGRYVVPPVSVGRDGLEFWQFAGG